MIEVAYTNNLLGASIANDSEKTEYRVVHKQICDTKYHLPC
jgi:hypothetical protein